MKYNFLFKLGFSLLVVVGILVFFVLFGGDFKILYGEGIVVEKLGKIQESLLNVMFILYGVMGLMCMEWMEIFYLYDEGVFFDNLKRFQVMYSMVFIDLYGV